MKKIPQRMCVACRQMQDKNILIRIVKTTEGNVEIDLTGKKNGRGAYICKNIACVEKEIKTKALSRQLEINIEPNIYEQLITIIKENE